jgi:3-hydroxyacyl-CoA dehydrogenase
MFYADQVGLPEVRDKLALFARETGNSALEPAPLLLTLAAERKGFASLNEKKAAA